MPSKKVEETADQISGTPDPYPVLICLINHCQPRITHLLPTREE